MPAPTLVGLGHGRFEEFRQIFGNLGAVRLGIVLQHTPDPDAIGSALALAWILDDRFGVEADIYYSGEISHPQNQTAINVLDIALLPHTAFDPARYEALVTVDTVPQNTGFLGTLRWIAVFDHHQFEPDVPFADIRNCGACASILWEYLHHFEMDLASERGGLVATALLLGIVSDTQNLLTENVTSLDLRAHAALMPHVDRKRFREIVNHPLPPYLFELRALAAKNMISKASILTSYLGILSDKRRDALPIIADEFLRMEGVETVVVFAMVGGSVQASVRSCNASVNVHQFCQRVFGAEHSGGKHGFGGARVPIGFLFSAEDDADDKEKLSEFLRHTLTKRIFRQLSGA